MKGTKGRQHTGILTVNLERLVPGKTVYAEFGNEVEFDIVKFTVHLIEGVRVHTETLHHTVRARNPTI